VPVCSYPWQCIFPLFTRRGAWAAWNRSLSTGKGKRSSGNTTEKTDAVDNPQYIKDYPLKVTPTIVLVHDGSDCERSEEVVPREQLQETFKKDL
jgi:hypothetical protein